MLTPKEITECKQEIADNLADLEEFFFDAYCEPRIFFPDCNRDEMSSQLSRMDKTIRELMREWRELTGLSLSC